MRMRSPFQKRFFLFGVGLLGLVGLAWYATGEFAASAEEKVKPKYVSVKNCKLCHTDKAAGDQYGQWKKSKHASAYDGLASAKAKEIAGKQGIKDPQKDLKCTKCHVTGIETPALSKTVKEKDGVQCESCHGAGEFYAKKEVFDKGKAAAVAAGLIEPEEKVCVKCHNKDSPTWTGKFDFAEMSKKIAHPNPKNAKK